MDFVHYESDSNYFGPDDWQVTFPFIQPEGSFHLCLEQREKRVIAHLLAVLQGPNPSRKNLRVVLGSSFLLLRFLWVRLSGESALEVVPY